MQSPAAGSGAAGSGNGATSPDPTSQPSAEGCGENLLESPEDPQERGAWKVGVRTVTIGRLATEIFYPAEAGSTEGKPEVSYDPREWLPAEDRDLVPEDRAPRIGPIGGQLFRDVPIDAQHGPYPVVIFIHGTAAFRVASVTLNTHWASRGFVVVAADYPFLGLTDKLNEACLRPYPNQDVPGDVNTQIQALTAASGEVAFLAGRVDMTRLAISGHSQGGCASAELSSLPNVRVVIPLSGSMPSTGSQSLQSILYISGMADTVIGYDTDLIGNTVCPPGSSNTVGAYEGTTLLGVKRIVGVTGGGHLMPTDLCGDNKEGRNAIEEAAADGVCGIDNAVFIGLPALFDCGTIGLAEGLAAVDYASTAALEETLQCKVRTDAFMQLQQKLPQVGDFRESR